MLEFLEWGERGLSRHLSEKSLKDLYISSKHTIKHTEGNASKSVVGHLVSESVN